MPKAIIISPSGKFYGSEQTLYNFLKTTRKSFKIFVRNDEFENGGLVEELNRIQHSHSVYLFDSLIVLYIKIAIQLFFTRVKSVYVNEGGHTKYIQVLSKIFPSCQFVIHLRLVEDAQKDRFFLKETRNLKFISVSNFIQEELKSNLGFDSIILSSPLRGGDHSINEFKSIDFSNVKIGVIGRITETKGVKYLYQFINYCEQKKQPYTFKLFGHPNTEDTATKQLIADKEKLVYCKVEVCGYVYNKTELFSDVDIVLHFNPNEPHGVIYLEALMYFKPFIGFNAGGIGDISTRIGSNQLMVELSENFGAEFLDKINQVNEQLENYLQARNRMLQEFSQESYNEQLESILIV